MLNLGKPVLFFLLRYFCTRLSLDCMYWEALTVHVLYVLTKQQELYNVLYAL